MSRTRERSPASAATQPRMLRIEYEGRPYDWFNLDEMGDIIRTNDFSNTLRENITHYFGVPYECQAVYDEEGILSTVVDFARALRSVRPWLRVYDIREMAAELREKTSKQLDDIQTEVSRCQRGMRGSNGFDASASNFGTSDRSFSSVAQPQRNEHSPARSQRDPSQSLADAVRSANESGLTQNSSIADYGVGFGTGVGAGAAFMNGVNGSARGQNWDKPGTWSGAAPSANIAQPAGSQMPRPSAPTAFPWGGALERAYSVPQLGTPRQQPAPPPPSIQPVGLQIPVTNAASVAPWASRAPNLGSNDPNMLAPWARAPATSSQVQLGAPGQPPAMPMYPAMTQQPRPYSGGAFATSGLPPVGAPLPGASTPPAPMAAPRSSGEAVPYVSVPGVWRQSSAGAASGTPPHPPPEASAAANVGDGAQRGPAQPPAQARDLQVVEQPQPPRESNSGLSQVQQGDDMIEVVLKKEPGMDKFGFANVPNRDNKSLLISWLDSSGLLHAHNRMVDASRQVSEGDRIIAVNGKREDVDAMRAELQSSSVRLLVQRATR